MYDMVNFRFVRKMESFDVSDAQLKSLIKGIMPFDEMTARQAVFWCINHFVFSNDGSRLFSCGLDTSDCDRGQAIRAWRLPELDQYSVLARYSSYILCIAVSDNNELIAIGFVDGRVIVLNSMDGSVLFDEVCHTGDITDLLFLSKRQKLASAGEDGEISLIDLKSFKKSQKLVGHRAAVNALSYCSRDDILYSGSLDCTILVWELRGISDT